MQKTPWDAIAWFDMRSLSGGRGMGRLGRVADPVPAGCGLAAVVDVETTGLRVDRDEIVELALVLFAFHRTSGEPVGIVDEYVGLREPSCPIPREAVAVHGITPEAVRGRALDHRRVRELLSRAEVLVAHHAAFDRAFVVRLYPEVADKVWLCTMRDIAWQRRGMASQRLQALLAAHGLGSDQAHRALGDCRATLELLAYRLADGSTYLQELLSHRSRLQPAAGNGAPGDGG
jgi:DNA polymerase-3 subunit epsilon